MPSERKRIRDLSVVAVPHLTYGDVPEIGRDLILDISNSWGWQLDNQTACFHLMHDGGLELFIHFGLLGRESLAIGIVYTTGLPGVVHIEREMTDEDEEGFLVFMQDMVKDLLTNSVGAEDLMEG